MANSTVKSVLSLTTAGSIVTSGVSILWIKFKATQNNDAFTLQDNDGGTRTTIFSYTNEDINLHGLETFWYLGGQRITGLWLYSISTGCSLQIGVK